ncbi:zinc ribbon domain-containing protein [Desulfurobacterium atlanticum]|uniref:Regulatory protein, FmdB family n=1 Tax=Desulfurobacterium atlanticum TaxID=240169 RepID=A0A238XU78_9BACT|nr:zinc ribbon domain-containing protein [Desulfurobacterium atlanticum]SNR62467.1 hypothetical protein SAMN06265340_101273 [Desulfurobacterium atlanticum]
MKMPVRVFKCMDCGEEFKVPFGKPKWMLECPECGSERIVRIGTEAGDFESREKDGKESEPVFLCCGNMHKFGWGWRPRFGKGFGWRRNGRGRGWCRG